MGLLNLLRKSKPVEQPLPPRCVLIVGDDEVTAEVVRQYLENAGFDVCAGSTVNEALAMLDRGPGVSFDLIIGDFYNPENDGRRFLQSARFRLGRTAFPPVIFLMDSESDEVVAKQMGVSEVLHKPVDSEMLIRCVQSRVAIRQLLPS